MTIPSAYPVGGGVGNGTSRGIPNAFPNFRQMTPFRKIHIRPSGETPMKRLVLRIAVLGSVVVLGVIAIAQAKRYAADPPQTDQSPSENKQQTPIASVEGSSMLGAEARQPLASEALPPPNTSLSQPPTGTAVVSAEQPVMESPFAARTGATAAAVALPDGQLSEGGVVQSGLPEGGQYALAAADAETAPRRFVADGTAFAQPAPSQASERAAPVSAPPAALGNSVADRYPPYGGGLATSREPAPVEFSPLEAPADPNGAATSAFPRELSHTYDTTGAPAAAPSSEGTGQPGSKQLEGPQSPQLTIQKSAPEEIQVGKPATFTVKVRNSGTIAADGVEVRDQIPKGTRLIETTPRAARGVRGELVWKLGTIQPDDDVEIEIHLLPNATGEIGSVATVSFSANASARSIATKPELVVETSAPKQVLIGEEVTLSIEVSNPGSGTATAVVLEEHVPAGLQHPAGSDLEYEIGDLPPGESCKLELTLTASRAGPVNNVLTVRDDGVLRVEDRLDLEVIAPQLDLAMLGPKRRYLEREATYTFSVSNPGTAAAEQVELVAYLPSGLKFVSANNAGHYEEADRTVRWQLEELPTDEKGDVQLVTLPVEAGQQSLRLRGTARKGLSVEEEQPVLIEGIAAIMFEVVDVNDPVEVGGETTYEIRVLNQGSKAATNVRLQVELPRQLQVVAAEGPARHQIHNGSVVFADLPRLAPKADTTYRVRVQGLGPGDLRTRVLLLTDEMETPVTKEESTRVYADQ